MALAPSTPLRALFVINSLAGGGAERVFSTLVRELDGGREGAIAPDGTPRLAITVALLDNEAEEAYAIPDGIPVVRLDAKGGLLRSFMALRQLVRRLDPDVAVSFLSRANIASVVAMGGLGKPAVISERVNSTAHLKSSRFGFLSRFLIRTCYPRARRIVAVSDGVAETLAQDFAVEREKICVIYNPVDIDGIRTLAAQQPAIAVSTADFVTMGRLVENKNIGMAIRALAVSKSRGKLIVLGEGPLKADLQAMATSLGVADRVVFAGFVANPHAILARAGCYLLTSNAEGFPNAMVEAMAAGLPIIATDCPSGPAEILEASIEGGIAGREPAFSHGGALVAVDDAVAMARCMDHISTPETRALMAQQARARVEAFSVERAVDSFRRAILDAVAQQRQVTQS